MFLHTKQMKLVVSRGVCVEIVAVTLSAHSFAGLGLAGVCVAGLDVLGGACEVFCRLWLETL